MNQAYQRVADKLGLDVELVETVIEHSFIWLRQQLSNPTKDKILINGFGTFNLLFPKIRKAHLGKRLSKVDRIRTQNLLEQFNQLPVEDSKEENQLTNQTKENNE